MLKLHPESQPLEIANDLFEKAGDDDAIPPEPTGGIPRQYLPSWIRWPLRLLFFPFMLLDLYAQRIARIFIRPPFRQIGKCKQRGNCCHYILIPAKKGPFSALYYFWNTQVLGFYRRDDRLYESEGKHVYIMGCRYLSKSGKCTRYTLRPAVCRKWPLIEYFGFPRLLKGCGFQAVPRHSAYKK
jgi:hypothetical protein